MDSVALIVTGLAAAAGLGDWEAASMMVTGARTSLPAPGAPLASACQGVGGVAGEFPA